jgi:O-acetyl-ADP-ribose deacetylase (regulator of RNase III)/membrane-associated phospholipid phosphatase
MTEMLTWLDALDKNIFFFINTSLANPVTDHLMPFFTSDLHLKIFYAACIIGILWKGDNRLRFAIIFSAICLAFSDQISSHFLKPLFARPRPCHVFEVHLLVGCGGGKSMPSSHAANLFGQAVLFWKIAPKSAKYLFPLAVVVALSRVFVGVHYPFDILVGTAVGVISGYAAYGLFKLSWDYILYRRAGRSNSMAVTINIKKGDITDAETDAIVNAANNALWMGSGVAGAIKRKGGGEIEKEAVAKGPIEIGAAVETTAGKLPFKYVIHAAGMGEDLKTDRNKVYWATKSSLELADRLGLSSLAFPAIGTGVGGMSLDECAEVMLGTVRELEGTLTVLQRVEFIFFDDAGFTSFENELKRISRQ